MSAHPSPSVPETAVPLTPLTFAEATMTPVDEALLLVLQKHRLYETAMYAGRYASAREEYRLLQIATQDYHQLLREGGNG